MNAPILNNSPSAPNSPQLAPLQDRNFLHQRHQLSHQQIDHWLGSQSDSASIPEKMQRMQWLRNFLLTTDQLRDRSIAFVCLKGPLLSQRLYGDPTVRQSIDIDLLIDLQHLEACLSLLQETGYTFAHGFHWPEDPLRQRLLTRHMHHIPLIHREQRLQIEIHWTLMTTPPLPAQDVQRLLAQHLTTLELSGRRFQVLTPEFELVFLLIHGARHGWYRLKWLLDIHHYSRLDFDESVFIQLIDRLRAGRILSQTNELLQTTFGSQLPDPHPQRVPAGLIAFVEDRWTSPASSAPKTVRRHLRDFAYGWHLFPGAYYKCVFTLGLFGRPADILAHAWPNRVVFYLYRIYSFVKRRLLRV